MLKELSFYGYKRRDVTKPRDFDAVLLRSADGTIVQLSPMPPPPPRPPAAPIADAKQPAKATPLLHSPPSAAALPSRRNGVGTVPQQPTAAPPAPRTSPAQAATENATLSAKFTELPANVKVTYVLSSSSSAWTDSEDDTAEEVRREAEREHEDTAEQDRVPSGARIGSHSDAHTSAGTSKDGEKGGPTAPDAPPHRPDMMASRPLPPPPPSSRPAAKQPIPSSAASAPPPPPPPPSLPMHGRVFAIHPTCLHRRDFEGIMVAESTSTTHDADSIPSSSSIPADNVDNVRGRIVPPSLRVLVVLGYDTSGSVYLQAFRPSSPQERSTVVLLPMRNARLWAASPDGEPAALADITDVIMKPATDAPLSHTHSDGNANGNDDGGEGQSLAWPRFVQTPVLGNLSTMAVLWSPPLQQRGVLADTFDVRPDTVYLLERQGSRTVRFIGVGWDGVPWITYSKPTTAEKRNEDGPGSANAPASAEHALLANRSNDTSHAPAAAAAVTRYSTFGDPLPLCYTEESLVQLCGLCDPLTSFSKKKQRKVDPDSLIGPAPPGYVPRSFPRIRVTESDVDEENRKEEEEERAGHAGTGAADASASLPRRGESSPPAPEADGAAAREAGKATGVASTQSGASSRSLSDSSAHHVFMKKGNKVTLPGPFGLLCECDASLEALVARFGVAHGDRLRERRQAPASHAPAAAARTVTVLGVCAGSPAVLFDGEEKATLLRHVAGTTDLCRLFVKVGGTRLPPPALPLEDEGVDRPAAAESAHGRGDTAGREGKEEEEEGDKKLVKFDATAEATPGQQLTKHEAALSEAEAEVPVEVTESIHLVPDSAEVAEELVVSAPTPAIVQAATAAGHDEADTARDVGHADSNQDAAAPLGLSPVAEVIPAEPAGQERRHEQEHEGGAIVVDYSRSDPSLAPTSLDRAGSEGRHGEEGEEELGSGGALGCLEESALEHLTPEDADEPERVCLAESDADEAAARAPEEADRSDTITPDTTTATMATAAPANDPPQAAQAPLVHRDEDRGRGAAVTRLPPEGAPETITTAATATKSSSPASPSIAIPSATERPLTCLTEEMPPAAHSTHGPAHGHRREEGEEEVYDDGDSSTDATPSHLPSLSFPRHGGHARDTESHFWSRPGSGSMQPPSWERPSPHVHEGRQPSAPPPPPPPLPRRKSGFTDFLKAYSLYMQGREQGSHEEHEVGEGVGADERRGECSHTTASLSDRDGGITIAYMQNYYATDALTKVLAAQEARRKCQQLWRAIAKNLRGTRISLVKAAPPGMLTEASYTDFGDLCVDEVVEFLRANEEFIFATK